MVAQTEDEGGMESAVSGEGGHPLDLDEGPCAPVTTPEERDSVLANSIRRVVAATETTRPDAVASFSNYV